MMFRKQHFGSSRVAQPVKDPIQRCQSYGTGGNCSTGSIPGPGAFTCLTCGQKKKAAAFFHKFWKEILSRLSYLFIHYINTFLNQKRAVFFQWEKALFEMKASLQKPLGGSWNPTCLGATERKTKWTFFLCSKAFLCRCVFLLINKSGQRRKKHTHRHSHSATVCVSTQGNHNEK